MSEDHLIAIRHPETGRLDHISIMGAAGNHFSLAIDLGDEARQRFNLIQSAENDDQPLPHEDTIALILDTSQLQASFSERGDLFKSELASIPNELLRFCDKRSVSPAVISAASPATQCLLTKTAEAPGIPCKFKKRLPALDDAHGSLMNFMGGGR